MPLPSGIADLFSKKKRKWGVVGFTALVAGLLTYWGIHGIGEYGIALFILTPLFIGFSAPVLYGKAYVLSKAQARVIGLETLLIFGIGLVIFAIEGLICLAMALPIAVVLTVLGSWLGYSLLHKSANQQITIWLLLTASIPAFAFAEKDFPTPLNSVTTSIEIQAAPEIVWKQVVEFPPLKEPEEFIFKTGIAYPIDARITGTGKGAVRHCNFTTGSFVEPITVWDEPYLLKFDVLEQPAPMREISFWDVNAPHLHDYFVSKEGQFKLTRLPNGNTLLEGTTWYFHRIKPAFYWQFWSSYIIHKIHGRVLQHIKANAEGPASQ